MSWEMVIGLETHVELKTKTKIFCSCEAAYGAEPNSCVCPVCMGLPGALPTLNEQAVRYAALAGLALDCHVHHVSRFDRKNYFYPDLPKAYQISQFYRPLCENGRVTLQTSHGEKVVGITRIHMEEDAGKLVHTDGGTLLDMNRCGVPLIEIVTEPDFRSSEEAVCYLRKLRAILTYTGVSDCRMNEGSLRCDVNLSVRHPGDPFGTRTEMKNLNSFQSVERAIASEFARQVELLEAGERVTQETRRFDQKTGKTYAMRRKEDSADYRYFPEPDLPDVVLSDALLVSLRQSLPTLPDARREQYRTAYGLTSYAAEQLTSEKWLADYFEAAVKDAQCPAALCNLLLGETQALLDASESIPIAPSHMAALSDLSQAGRVNSSTAKRILAALFQRDQDPEEYARINNLFTLDDDGALQSAVHTALEQNPSMVQAFRAGKQSVEKALMGKAMALTQGRANPQRLAQLLTAELARL